MTPQDRRIYKRMKRYTIKSFFNANFSTSNIKINILRKAREAERNTQTGNEKCAQTFQ
jgi:hypothetical protein